MYCVFLSTICDCIVCVCLCGGVVGRGGAWWRRPVCSVANVNADGAAEDGAEGEAVFLDASETSLPQLRSSIFISSHSAPRCFPLVFFSLPPLSIHITADISAQESDSPIRLTARTHRLVSGEREQTITVEKQKSSARRRHPSPSGLEPDTPTAGLSCHSCTRHGRRQSR